MSLVALFAFTVVLQTPVAEPVPKPQLQEITLSIQGMTCDACAVKVKNALEKRMTLIKPTLRFQPSVAHFWIDPKTESIQDLVTIVRGAGSQYDARLMLESDFDDDKLSEALRQVQGVRSAGMKNKNNIRLLTFHMDKKTYYTDLEIAANDVGAKITSPTFEKENPGS
jgi:copper chaperone CopZ